MFLPVILFFTPALQEEPTYSHLRMPVLGTVYRGKLYGLFGEEEPRVFRLHSFDLKKSGPEAHCLYNGLLSGTGVYHRWRIRFNRVSLSEGYAVIKSMSFDEVAQFDRRLDPSGTRGYYEKYRKSKGDPGIIGLPALAKKKPFMNAILPLDVAVLTGLGTVPTSENTLRTFLLLKDKTEMEVWDTEVRFNAKTMTWENVADEKNLEKIKSAFSEDFYVFIRKDVYYFITESGKLYSAPPPRAGEKSREMRGLWTNPKRPIVAVIEDADNDRVWLFAKDKSPGAKLDFRFEMKEALLDRPFDPTKLQPSKVEGRAKTLLEYLPLISAEPKK
jgi:hypothetical protein